MGHSGDQAAAAVRSELAKQNRTRVWLSDCTGIRLRTLTRMLNPNELSRAFDLDELKAIADALGVPMLDLLGREVVGVAA